MCRGLAGYTGCQDGGKPAISAPSHRTIRAFPPGAKLKMNSFEMNKVLGAVLGTCLGVVALNIASGAVFAPGKLDKPGYDIVVPEKAPAGGAPKEPAQPEVPIGELLAKADVGKGQSSAQKCGICHTFDKGGKNLLGPNLWGVVGRPKASEAGFNYSAAMKAK